MRQKRFFLTESEIPTRWYNITADMQNKPQQMPSPATGNPVTEDELAELFCRECSRQELNTTDRWIEIPDEVREKYTYYRSTPLVRAYGLEEALGTPAHIYFKNESVSPAPESCHAIAACITEALECKEKGEQKTILFCLSGHGLIDMTAYDQFLSGNMTDFKNSNGVSHTCNIKHCHPVT